MANVRVTPSGINPDDRKVRFEAVLREFVDIDKCFFVNPRTLVIRVMDSDIHTVKIFLNKRLIRTEVLVFSQEED